MIPHVALWENERIVHRLSPNKRPRKRVDVSTFWPNKQWKNVCDAITCENRRGKAELELLALCTSRRRRPCTSPHDAAA